MAVEAYRRIEGYEKLTSYFGHWPSFNDGYVQSVCVKGTTVDLQIFVDDVQAERARRPFRAEVTLRWEGVERFDLSVPDVMQFVNGRRAEDGYYHGFLSGMKVSEVEGNFHAEFFDQETDFTACLRSARMGVVDVVPVETVEEEAYREYEERSRADV